MPLCEHFDTGVEVDAPPNVCWTCVSMGSTWVHLRQCLNCGKTSCCDNSPNRHATAHFHETAHPMIRTAQPDEDWRWCYPDELFFIPSPDGGYEVAED
ncbi:MAG: Isopeptidase [Chloroflexi bacterium]|nr:Isopeptidase [Chloroflexota bacterium]